MNLGRGERLTLGNEELHGREPSKGGKLEKSAWNITLFSHSCEPVLEETTERLRELSKVFYRLTELGAKKLENTAYQVTKKLHIRVRVKTWASVTLKPSPDSPQSLRGLR